MLDMYAEEDAKLEHYGVNLEGPDRKVKANRIPLDRAIEIVAKKGLPVRPNPPERAKELAYPEGNKAYKVSP